MDVFTEPHKISKLLTDFHEPWFFCGGWAIDLFLNRVTRLHKDVDVAMLRTDQLVIQAYLTQCGWTLEKAVNGKLFPWVKGEFIQLPVHTIWCKHAAYDPNFFEVLFNETNSTHFLFRRDQTISSPHARMSMQSASDLPILAPEIVLLYKADRPDNEENMADFMNVIPFLNTDRRTWLQASLVKLSPEHPWLSHIKTTRL